MDKMINVEVAYARADKQEIIAIELHAGSTIEQAILQSGILDIFPEIDLTKQQVGIFSQPRELSDAVKNGERIEIYRPLMMDPKEARRRKAKKSKK